MDVPSPGDFLIPTCDCGLWTDDMEDAVDVQRGDLLLVLGTTHTYAGTSNPPKMRLNHNLYRRVLAPSGCVGWVHQDNCRHVVMSR